MDEREMNDRVIAFRDLINNLLGAATSSQRIDARRELVGEYQQVLKELCEGRRTTPDREAWQPIETAPKDGKRVLVFEPGSRGGVWVAHFLRYPGKPDQWVNPGCHKINPSHWMPLPTAPTSDKGGA
ncbi:DUF551 domain-containing protein (plasmid) [Burkholderia cenocepacia]|uniref:DUF551 domain-containing protein n=1 Tax=Burkholderia cenocepacia TaxID=95486 RepID=UPI001F17F9FB|nr:DUF551 domain-containing protein [Burkholderia cenocepacia]UJH75011.1 DUF551 domain-containing protein [Burkholderia cenocepacia]